MSPNIIADIAQIGGAIIPIFILRWIFKRFIFRKNIETVLRKFLLYSLVFIVSVVLASMGAGEGGFVQRLENIPSIRSVFVYGVATLIVIGFDLLISAFRNR
jgi:hypothetical protein